MRLRASQPVRPADVRVGSLASTFLVTGTTEVPTRGEDRAVPRKTALPKTRRAATITAWVLQILLGFAIAGAGLLKLTGDPTMVELFDDIGAGQWLRFVVGALEVAGGVGLVIPRVRALAALCLLGLLLGAAVTNVAVLHTSPLSALAFAALALAILLLRRHELLTRASSVTSWSKS